MKSLSPLLLIGLMLSLLTACGSTPIREEAGNIQRVGILNLFQDLPSYTKLTTTDDIIQSAQLPDMRGYLTQKVAEALKTANIEAVEVRDHLPLLRGEVDMILELQPRLVTEGDEVAGIRYDEKLEPEGKNGYGYYYKSLFLIKRGPESYLEMRIVAVVNQSGKLELSTEYGVARRDKLDVPELPNSWQQLSAHDNEVLVTGLQHTIDNGISTMVSKMGL